MSSCKIFLDESGDLGFKFTHPYRAGGSSRHLTLGAIICPDDSDKYITRFVADFYTKRGIKAGKERKWSELKPHSRLEFANSAAELQKKRPVLRFVSMTAYKQNVEQHIQGDPNKLYNYMAGRLLLPIFKGFDNVSFIPDARSVKVEAGASIGDYLSRKLIDEGCSTTVVTTPSDSCQCRQLHFSDWICGVVQASFEDGQSAPMQALSANMLCRKLFFPV